MKTKTETLERAYLNIRESAEYLGISWRQLYRLKIPSFQVRYRRFWLIKVLDEYKKGKPL